MSEGLAVQVFIWRLHHWPATHSWLVDLGETSGYETNLGCFPSPESSDIGNVLAVLLAGSLDIHGTLPFHPHLLHLQGGICVEDESHIMMLLTAKVCEIQLVPFWLGSGDRGPCNHSQVIGWDKQIF